MSADDAGDVAEFLGALELVDGGAPIDRVRIDALVKAVARLRRIERAAQGVIELPNDRAWNELRAALEAAK